MLVDPICMFMDDGRKPVHLGTTHTALSRTRQLKFSSPLSSSNPATFSCEVTTLTTAPLGLLYFWLIVTSNQIPEPCSHEILFKGMLKKMASNRATSSSPFTSRDASNADSQRISKITSVTLQSRSELLTRETV